MLALLGVLVGGLLTVVTTSVLDLLARRREARAAALLLTDDLTDLMSLLWMSLQLGVWADRPSDVLTDGEWLKQRAIVARVKFPPWYPVTGAYSAAIRLARVMDQEGAAKGDDLPSEGDDHRQMIEFVVMSMNIALAALTEYARQPAYSDGSGNRDDDEAGHTDEATET